MVANETSLDIIGLSKEIQKASKQAKRVANTGFCWSCQKSVPSFCSSHTVPRFVLENIADNGRVYRLLPTDNPLIEICEQSERGIANANIFYIICRDCDSKLFKDYEKKEALASFMNSSDSEKQKILAEIVLKNALRDMYRESGGNHFFQTVEKNTNSFAQTNQIPTYTDLSEMKSVAKMDYKDAETLAEQSLHVLQTGEELFDIIYCSLIDRNLPVAAQVTIAPHVGLDRKPINNPYDHRAEPHFLFACFFPLGAQTLELLFCLKNDRSHFDSFADFFSQPKKGIKRRNSY